MTKKEERDREIIENFHKQLRRERRAQAAFKAKRKEKINRLVEAELREEIR